MEGDCLMEIHAIIGDTTEFVGQSLRDLLEKEANVTVDAYTNSSDKLIDLYFEHRPEVLFINIDLLDNIEVSLVQQLKEITIELPLLVFFASDKKGAYQAIEYGAVDYLLMPISLNKYYRMLERLRELLCCKNEKIKAERNLPATNKLLIDDGEKMIVVAPSSIYYAVPSQRLLEIHTEDKVIESKLTLQELEKKLAGRSFFRTHRSYLVNLNQVLEITPWFNGAYNITLKDKDRTTIPVSRSARKSLFERFGS